MRRNHRIITVVLGLLLAVSLAAEKPLWTLLPKTNDYQSFLSFCEVLAERRGNFDMTDDEDGPDFFALLIDAGRDEAVLNLARAMVETDPNDSYYYAGRFNNPVVLAYLAGRVDLMKRLIEVDPTLVQWESMYENGSGIVVAAACVRKDDLDTMKYLVSKRADLKTICVANVGLTVPFASDLLTISPSKRMTDYLLSKGTPDFYRAADHAIGDFVLKALCAIESVNLRKSPSPSAPALAGIKKGESFEVLGYSFYNTTLGGGTSRWTQVKYKGVEGWVFGTAIKWDVKDEGTLPWMGMRTLGSMEDW